MITIHVPGSKSYTQRAIFIAALTPGNSTIENHLICDDSHHLIDAIKQLGATVEERHHKLHISNIKSFNLQNSPKLYLGNAGTAVRFVSALSIILSPGFTMTGNKYMQKRPMQDMIDALKFFGVQADTPNGCLPITYTGPKRSQINEINPPSITPIQTKTSTQYLSGLLMVCPTLNHNIKLQLLNSESSLPYVDMTLQTMKEFGVDVTTEYKDEKIISYQVNQNSQYNPTNYVVETDWSSASYIYAASFITDKKFSIPYLNLDSKQGDKIIHSITAKMTEEKNKETELNFHLDFAPDIIPTVVAMAFHRKGPTFITGIEKLQFKETDRTSVMIREFSKLGGNISVDQGILKVFPSKLKQTSPIDPDKDHRMAMAVRTALLPQKEVEIIDASCINKSYPNFYKDIALFTV